MIRQWIVITAASLFITFQQGSGFVLQMETRLLPFASDRSCAKPHQTQLAASQKNSNDSPATQANYNDDAFGLVFLGSFLAAKDIAFASTFLVLSAAAATATNTGVWNRTADPRIPAAVAIASLILRPLVAVVANAVLQEDLDVVPGLPVVGVTVASTVWALFLWQKDQKES